MYYVVQYSLYTMLKRQLTDAADLEEDDAESLELDNAKRSRT